MHEFGAGDADRAGDGHAAVFVEGPAVDDDDIASRGDGVVEFAGGHGGRLALGLDGLAERLAGYMHAVEDFEPGGAPPREPALENPRVAIAEACEPFGGAHGAVVGRAVVEQRDERSAPRNEAVDFEFEPPWRQRGGEERMPARMFADLAHIEQRDLGPGAKPPLDVAGRDGLGHRRFLVSGISTPSSGAATPVGSLPGQIT